MFRTAEFAVAIAAATLVFAATADAQTAYPGYGPLVIGGHTPHPYPPQVYTPQPRISTPPSHVHRPPVSPRTPSYPPQPAGPVWPNGPIHPTPVGPSAHPSHWPTQPRISQPVIVTPNEYDGINPWTGGVDTKNTQVNDSYYDYGRNESRHNGTARRVRRPVYRNGQVVGYQDGIVWNNSYTGQEHFELEGNTSNHHGGNHRQQAFGSSDSPAGE